MAGKRPMRACCSALAIVPKNGFCVVELVSNGAGADVRIEQTGIEHENLDEGREAELASLQDDVLKRHLIEQGLLRPVHLKAELLPVLVRDVVEIVDPPAPVAEAVEGGLVARVCCHRSLSEGRRGRPAPRGSRRRGRRTFSAPACSSAICACRSAPWSARCARDRRPGPPRRWRLCGP